LTDNFDFDFPGQTLRDRLILLAGGSGGLGAGVASLLAQEGARLLISYRHDEARAKALASHLGDRFQARVSTVGADICQQQGRERLMEAVSKAGEPLYALVCLVGNPARVKLGEAQDQDLAASLEQNFTGPILLARDAVNLMKEARTPGSIVLFSTMQAVALFPGSITYAAPKSALIQAARVLAKENAGPCGIRVNVIAPGVNEAGMALASIRSGKYDRFVEEGIIPRFGRAEDVARAVRLFLEPDNYITGQVLAVDGGFTLQV